MGWAQRPTPIPGDCYVAKFLFKETSENVIIAPGTALPWGYFSGVSFPNQHAAVDQGHF